MTPRQPKGEPIPIVCEGSGQVAHPGFDLSNCVCAVCGQYEPTSWSNGSAIAGIHTRDDILARIDRGDFG